MRPAGVFPADRADGTDIGRKKEAGIRDCETMEIVLLPSKYLKHKTKANRSPNTVKRAAFAICYYLEYLKEIPMEATQVYGLDYEKQNEHFVNFLHWLKAGNHKQEDSQRKINNGTCNAYLEDVFRFYLFVEAEYEQFGSLRHMVGVYFRDDNENEARAKNAEYRKAKVSDKTFEFLMYYLAEYRELLQRQRFLFINITGDTAGQPLKVDSVYDMLERMEKKTGISLTPHMLRRYFANMRRKAGWRLELIQQALGHKHIDTTIKYLNIVDDELLEASREFYEKHSAMYGVEKLL